GLARLAEQAFAAFGGIQGNDVVARRHTGDAFADLDDDARALVPQHGGEDAFGVIASQGEGVGVADAGMGDPDQDLALAGRFDVDLDDLQGFAGLEGHGGAGFHRSVSNSVWPNGVQGRLWTEAGCKTNRPLHAARIRLAQDSPQGTVLCPARPTSRPACRSDSSGTRQSAGDCPVSRLIPAAARSCV